MTLAEAIRHLEGWGSEPFDDYSEADAAAMQLVLDAAKEIRDGETKCGCGREIYISSCSRCNGYE